MVGINEGGVAMKYIRTKNGKIYEIVENDGTWTTNQISKEILEKALNGNKYFKDDIQVIKQADTIEELCDEFDIIVPPGIYRYGIYHARYEGWGDFKRAWRDFKEKNGDDYRHYEILGAYGAIWTDKGLIYVAKMNEDGKLCLL